MTVASVRNQSNTWVDTGDTELADTADRQTEIQSDTTDADTIEPSERHRVFEYHRKVAGRENPDLQRQIIKRAVSV